MRVPTDHRIGNRMSLFELLVTIGSAGSATLVSDSDYIDQLPEAVKVVRISRIER